ncbi:MAG: methyltransferase domain-containing protein [Actinobacteria bacterium]|nr:methyltransferase domain-containing protein [Actinomycetota bacterium]
MTSPHTHGHHHHAHDDEFDWEAMADSLELDSAITLPIVHEIVRTCTPHVEWATIGHVLDIGCGPGAVAVALSRHAPRARITALDSSAPLLGRVRHRAAQLGLDDRIWTIAADLDGTLPTLPPVDVVWASMVLHHVSHAVVTLGRLKDALAPGGTLVMVEFGNAPTVLPVTDPMRESGVWGRFQSATAATLNERLGLDPVGIDWPALLDAAGYVDIVDQRVAAHHPSPLDDTARTWLTKHVGRGLEMAAERLTADDGEALGTLLHDIPQRDDLFVHAERRVVVARRGAAE